MDVQALRNSVPRSVEDWGQREWTALWEFTTRMRNFGVATMQEHVQNAMVDTTTTTAAPSNDWQQSNVLGAFAHMTLRVFCSEKIHAARRRAEQNPLSKDWVIALDVLRDSSLTLRGVTHESVEDGAAPKTCVYSGRRLNCYARMEFGKMVSKTNDVVTKYVDVDATLLQTNVMRIYRFCHMASRVHQKEIKTPEALAWEILNCLRAINADLSSL